MSEMVAPEIARLLNEFGRRLTLCGGNDQLAAKACFLASELETDIGLTECGDLLLIGGQIVGAPSRCRCVDGLARVEQTA